MADGQAGKIRPKTPSPERWRLRRHSFGRADRRAPSAAGDGALQRVRRPGADGVPGGNHVSQGGRGGDQEEGVGISTSEGPGGDGKELELV